jgi:transposase-like protein
MKVKKSSLKQNRIFSEVVRKQVVRDIEQCKYTVIEASRELQVCKQTIYTWLYKYSLYLQKQHVLVVEDKSEAMRSKELLKRIAELEAALGRKQMEVDLLNKILDLANKEYKLDLKKNILDQLSNGTEDIKE